MKTLSYKGDVDSRTFLKYGIYLPLMLCLVAVAPLYFGPLVLLYILYHRKKYFREEEINEL